MRNQLSNKCLYISWLSSILFSSAITSALTLMISTTNKGLGSFDLCSTSTNKNLTQTDYCGTLDDLNKDLKNVKDNSIASDCVAGIIYVALITSDLIFKRVTYNNIISFLPVTSFSFFGIGLGFLIHHGTLSGQTRAGQSLGKTYSAELVGYPPTEHVAHEMRQCDRWPLSFPCFLLGLITLLTSQRDKLDVIYHANNETRNSSDDRHNEEEQVYTSIKAMDYNNL